MQLHILLIVLAVILILGICIGIPEYKERESKQRYKVLLMNECMGELINKSTLLRTHSHKFDWDYYTSRLTAEWKVMTPRFSVTFRGHSEVTKDVKDVDEFFTVSTIDYVDIYTGSDNISVLHTYRNTEDINRLIEGVKILEKNNKYKSQSDKYK